jgi:hypothetical protein
MKTNIIPITTTQLRDFLGWVYNLDGSFPYSKLDFYFKKDLFGFKTSNVGAGNTRTFNFKDVLAIKVMIDVQKLLQNVNVTKYVGSGINFDIEWEEDFLLNSYIVIQGKDFKYLLKSVVNHNLDSILEQGARPGSPHCNEPVILISVGKNMRLIKEYFEC